MFIAIGYFLKSILKRYNWNDQHGYILGAMENICCNIISLPRQIWKFRWDQNSQLKQQSHHQSLVFHLLLRLHFKHESQNQEKNALGDVISYEEIF